MTGRGRNGSEPADALGTIVPSMGPTAGGPPQITYPFGESEAVMPHKVIAIAWELLGQFQAKAAMDLGRDRGILKIICIFVTLVMEVKPRLRILVDEERRE